MSAVAAELPRTLAEFAAAPDDLLAHLKASGKGRRLQIEGGRTVVVVDEEAFRKLLKEELRSSILASVIEADAGHTMDAKEFFAQLRREQGRS